MAQRFIDDYEVLLLDMGNTFMFGGDRFGEEQDYYATYARLGGTALSREKVQTYIQHTFESMLTAARTPARVDDFGSIHRFLLNLDGASALPPDEIERLIHVFAEHEVGTISQQHAAALHALQKTHPLGLISNIWAPNNTFENAFDQAGVLDLFAVRVWSSDSYSIKPSPRLFQKALDAFDIEPSRVAYVGDNPQRDIAGAKAMQMGAVWIENHIRPLTADTPRPDLVISDLTELATAPTR